MKKALLLIFICLMSCQNDIENINIEGIVSSHETNSPLKGVELTIVCWYYGNSPDQSYTGEETKRVTTDSKGKYEISFDKGAFIEITINKNGFARVHKSEYINDKNSVINIKMEPL